MRRRLAVPLLCYVALAELLACKRAEPQAATPAATERRAAAAAAPAATLAEQPRPANSVVVALEKALQEDKLPLPARREHAPRLAFAKGVFGQLTRDGLRVYDSADFRLLATEPLEGPRALLALADGSLLAIGARNMLRWEREKKRPSTLPKPVLLPGVQLFADAQQADVLWIFDGESQGGGSGGPATLASYRLKPDQVGLLLPEQTRELASPRGGVFGVTREGVWLYVSNGHVERFSPGGLRLPGFALKEISPPTWLLPAWRLDQSLWLDEAGHVSRVLVSPSYKLLSRTQLAGKAVDADAGDEGRLLAVLVVTGAGPRFELSLLDQELALLGRAVLPSDAPTGADDWVKVVTENQGVVVAPRQPWVAVGGPQRVTIFNAQAETIFSIPSK